MMKKTYITTFIILVCVLFSQAQQVISKQQVADAFSTIPQEKMYVHYNTPLLFAGEYLYYKLYCLMAQTNKPYSVFFVTDEGQIKAFQSSIFSVPVPTITYNFRF